MDEAENRTALSVGNGITSGSARWTFANNVAATFDDHVSKSVPLYEQAHALGDMISDFFVKNDSIVYELGCSTGALVARLAKKHADLEHARFVGVDVEESMVMHARTRYAQLGNLSFSHADVTEFEFEKSDFILSYYTIQFVHPKHRQRLFDRIYDRLEWGGGFLLFEKVRAPDARFQDLITNLYAEYKLKSNFTPEEILAKTMSLRGVMEPFSSQANHDFLTRAGFKDIMPVQKYLCFEGILAIK